MPVLRLLAPAATILHLRTSSHMRTPHHWPLSQVLTGFPTRLMPLLQDPTRLSTIFAPLTLNPTRLTLVLMPLTQDPTRPTVIPTPLIEDPTGHTVILSPLSKHTVVPTPLMPLTQDPIRHSMGPVKLRTYPKSRSSHSLRPHHLQIARIFHHQMSGHFLAPQSLQDMCRTRYPCRTL